MSDVFKAWIEAALAAFVIGCSTVLGTEVVDGQVTDWKRTLTVSLLAGVGSLAAYLKRSPLPGVEKEKEQAKGEADANAKTE